MAATAAMAHVCRQTRGTSCAMSRHTMKYHISFTIRYPRWTPVDASCYSRASCFIMNHGLCLLCLNIAPNKLLPGNWICYEKPRVKDGALLCCGLFFFVALPAWRRRFLGTFPLYLKQSGRLRVEKCGYHALLSSWGPGVKMVRTGRRSHSSPLDGTIIRSHLRYCTTLTCVFTIRSGLKPQRRFGRS